MPSLITHGLVEPFSRPIAALLCMGYPDQGQTDVCFTDVLIWLTVGRGRPNRGLFACER
jgi:hypothetical protein